MAKSIRSKWKRKCRAVKRERYGKKELDRLKITLGIDDIKAEKADVEMGDISDIANVVDGRKLKKVVTEENDMETDTSKRVFNPKTLRDQHGAYPVWMHPRKINKKKPRKGKKVKKDKS